MDVYLEAARASMRLVEQALEARQKKLEKRPVGMVLRENQIKHTIALLSLAAGMIDILRHDPGEWWTNEEDAPF